MSVLLFFFAICGDATRANETMTSYLVKNRDWKGTKSVRIRNVCVANIDGPRRSWKNRIFTLSAVCLPLAPIFCLCTRVCRLLEVGREPNYETIVHLTFEPEDERCFESRPCFCLIVQSNFIVRASACFFFYLTMRKWV